MYIEFIIQTGETNKHVHTDKSQVYNLCHLLTKSKLGSKKEKVSSRYSVTWTIILNERATRVVIHSIFVLGPSALGKWESYL